ncbi:MAG: CHC2 zinc finger domain-containing protein, partial [Deltaproteobacteria bacterium]|nr:CHC2 zinc finger domain-containing protein [Deltaproteobacteria bacterium]
MSYSIPAEKISEIKHSADILEIISDAVVLKKAGRNYLGLCPFHSEKTPSFTVSPDKQMFYCFGCGEGGNVFTFVMKQEGIAFPEAVRFLAKRYGIMIVDQTSSPAIKNHMDERELLFQINRQAMEF